MSDQSTTPRQRQGLPVLSIRVQVRAGPDAGALSTPAADTVSVGTAEGNALRVTDPTVSRFHLTLERRGDRIVVTDHGSTNGTQIGPALLRGAKAEVLAGTEIGLGDTRLRVDDGSISTVDDAPTDGSLLVGRAPAMRRLRATLAAIAAQDISVLVLGESGTGKELVARELHRRSARRDGPLVTVDCGALSPTLAASALFGHERGAFTGAEARHIGAFERAQGGTIFLDEVGELPPQLQTALLGALERREVQRLGGASSIPIDVRLVAATHRDLRADVNAGRFRLDLFYRLAVVVLTTPPLRERLDDLEDLIEHFLAEADDAPPLATVFPEPELERLRQHDWPGNVRELRNVVQGTLALGRTAELRAGEPVANGKDVIAAALQHPYREARALVVERFERRYLQALLRRTNGNIREAARQASMDRSYLMELLKRHGMR